MQNIFQTSEAETFIDRINNLNTDTKQLWGKMTVAQMLAHCNVTYEMVYEEDKHKKPNFFLKLILKMFIKNTVVSEKPYDKNGRTAPQFIKTEIHDFEKEKARLIGYIRKTQQLGEAHFEGKESHSFGFLTSKEWNNSFTKHLNHHLEQFGA